MALELKSLAAGYDGRCVIKDISAVFNPGEVTAILGGNGAGKSTLIKAVAGFIKPMGGCVRLDGVDVGSISRNERARRIGVMLTKSSEAGFMSCRETVAMGRYPYTGYFGVLSAEDQRVTDEAMELCDCSDMADTDVQKLSDGQRQRVMIARAICQEPEILLLDQPTAFLDIRYQLDILALLQRLAVKKQMAVLYSVHQPRLALYGSDRILALKGGGQFMFGPASALAGRIRELFDMDSIEFDMDTNRRLYEYSQGVDKWLLTE